MNKMKKIRVYFTALIMGLSYFISTAQIIHFPDANFKNALVNTKCVDTNGDGEGDADADLNDDGEIDVSEALNVINLYINNRQISSLDGIENFKNLSILVCSINQLTSLDVKELTNLTTLRCFFNQLSFLNVQGLTNLTELYCDKNLLTSLDLQGLTNLKNLECNMNKLTSLNVQGLTNLTYFYCEDNLLTTLDVHGLTNLTFLKCHNNQLTSLNVQGLLNLTLLACDKNKLTSLGIQGLIKLATLSCSYNQLISLNVQGLINLTLLDCRENKLTTLDLQGLIKLGYLDCRLNQLTSLNVQGLINLQSLYCGENKLTTLDLQGLIKFATLYCNDNQLTSLDVQGLANLTHLTCSNNQLTSLYIKGSKIIGNLFFQNNLNLSYICCDENKINSVKNKSMSYGLNCEVNSYCSFTPGGKFYIIDGNTYYDYNNSGCDEQDTKLPNFKYNITDGSTSGSLISNSTGYYSIPVQEGTHTITPILEHPDHFDITPPSFTVTFPSTSDTITQDFCITTKGILRQTNITVIPLTPPARPGFGAYYKIVWENVGNQIENGTLNFTYDESLLDYISATQTPDQISDGIVKWNFTNLHPFEKREITVTLKVNRPTDTPAVNSGDKLYLVASILDNIFVLENTVVGSYDPNDKTCLQGDRIHPDMIGKYVDFLIRFENTGDYAAENVVIKDIIDISKFDISTLKITDASHEMYTRIEGNKVEFIFENIQLPFEDAYNDGHVAFKIKTLPTVVLGDSLKNLADIYFDYNFPIRTNETQSTIALPSFTFDIISNINIYPNPVNDILYLETDDKWTKAEIYDISGRILRSVSLDSSSIDVNGLESGTYIMRMRNGDKVGRVKFVKI